jgi:hypothetical protein
MVVLFPLCLTGCIAAPHWWLDAARQQALDEALRSTGSTAD